MELPENIRRSVISRRAEFFFGRLCAQEALRTFLPEYVGTPKIGRGRSPIWPEGFAGSITHTNNLAAAVVIPTDNIAGIGLDIEVFMTSSLAAEISKNVLHERDLKLSKELAIPFEIFTTIAFSAKESLFKALYPLTKTFFDFQDAAIRNLDLEGGHFELLLLRTLSDSWQASSLIEGSIWFEELYVRTLVVTEGRPLLCHASG